MWVCGGAREGAVVAAVVVGAREPSKVAASVKKEREGLRRIAEAERDGIGSIAVGEDWGCCGFGGLWIFEVVGSG